MKRFFESKWEKISIYCLCKWFKNCLLLNDNFAFKQLRFDKFQLFRLVMLWYSQIPLFPIFNAFFTSNVDHYNNGEKRETLMHSGRGRIVRTCVCSKPTTVFKASFPKCHLSNVTRVVKCFQTYFSWCFNKKRYFVDVCDM